jgi:hypothetical protein
VENLLPITFKDGARVGAENEFDFSSFPLAILDMAVHLMP